MNRKSSDNDDATAASVGLEYSIIPYLSSRMSRRVWVCVRMVRFHVKTSGPTDDNDGAHKP